MRAAMDFSRMSTLPVIGFIGTGVMGRSMAQHLKAAGHELHVHNRTREKAQSLVDSGAQWHDSPADVARAADVVITMLGFPSDVEDIYLGHGKVVASARPGALLIDMTTSSPVLARRIASDAAARGLESLHAPGSRRDICARHARLGILVRRETNDLHRAEAILQRM